MMLTCSRLRLLTTVLLTVGTFISLSALHAQEAAPSLSLSQRRALKQYQETRFPELQRQINEAAKFDVPLEVQWEAIASHGEAQDYLRDTFFTDIYFTPLIDALQGVAAERTKPLQAKLKKVVFTCDRDAASVQFARTVQFKDGTLTIDFEPFTNAMQRRERTQAIAAMLGKIP